MFNTTFWKQTAESAIVTFATTLGGSQVFSGGTISAKSFYASLIAAGIAAAYVFVKALGGVQAVASLAPKATTPTKTV